jgi:DNA-directed RNA polymerase subunit M/transcription elongation factor TFIIS
LFLKLEQPQEGTVILTWETDGTFTLTQHKNTILHLVPIPAMLGTASDDNTLQQYLDNLASAADNIASTLILYPAPSEDYQLDKRLYTVGNEGFSKLGWLPVSPLKIHSVERVARALRWALGKRFLNYPPQINTTLDLDDIGLSSHATWLKKVSSKSQQLQMLRLPRSDERALLKNLDNKIKEFEQSLKEKQQQRQQVQHNDNHRLRAQLKKEITQLEEQLKKLTGFRSELDTSLKELERLLFCPLCEEKIDAHYGFQIRTKKLLHTFWCECPNCKAIWGTQSCTSCHQLYPILLPNVEESLKMISETVGWMDERLGSDILVIPQLPFDGKFICPECGN